MRSATWMLACCLCVWNCSESPLDAKRAGATSEQTQLGASGWLRFVSTAQQGVEQGSNTFSLVAAPASSGSLSNDAQLTVTVTMPAHHHSSTVTPRVDPQGGGKFTVSNVVFSMGGTWDVTYTVTQGQQQDSADFDYDVH